MTFINEPLLPTEQLFARDRRENEQHRNPVVRCHYCPTEAPRSTMFDDGFGEHQCAPCRDEMAAHYDASHLEAIKRGDVPVEQITPHPLASKKLTEDQRFNVGLAFARLNCHAKTIAHARFEPDLRGVDRDVCGRVHVGCCRPDGAEYDEDRFVAIFNQ